MDNKTSMKICKRLDKIAADMRKASVEANRKLEIFTHVQRDGKILVTVQPEEYQERLGKHFQELQRITAVLWKPIFFHAEINRDGKASSTINAAGYRKDHFFDGYERLTYGQYELTPEQVVFGEYPIGLETEILMKELNRERQRRKR